MSGWTGTLAAALVVGWLAGGNLTQAEEKPAANLAEKSGGAMTTEAIRNAPGQNKKTRADIPQEGGRHMSENMRVEVGPERNNDPAAAADPEGRMRMDRLEESARTAWRTAWERLYDPRTSLFYDFVSSYDPRKRFDHLPTAEEVARQFPNACGWATGMEDSTISADVMLSAACDRFDVTGEEELREDAARIFAGLKLCGTASSAPGLVLRSVSPFDGKSHYSETSVDQVTHFAHALWRFDRSPLCSDAQRADMRTMIESVCARMERMVVPENDYHCCRETGERGMYDKMWKVWEKTPSEVCTVGRLPSVYAVGWKLTNNRHWFELYRSYAAEAAELGKSLKPEGYKHCYPLFQHQVSLEVLAAVAAADGDEALETEWRRQMTALGAVVARYARDAFQYEPVDVETFAMGWRGRPLVKWMQDAGYAVAEWPPQVLKEFDFLRHGGEALLIKLMAGLALAAEDRRCLEHSLAAVDYSKLCTYAMLYPQAAYWRWRANAKQKNSAQPGDR